jgi:hypothetical protein
LKPNLSLVAGKPMHNRSVLTGWLTIIKAIGGFIAMVAVSVGAGERFALSPTPAPGRAAK